MTQSTRFKKSGCDIEPQNIARLEWDVGWRERGDLEGTGNRWNLKKWNEKWEFRILGITNEDLYNKPGIKWNRGRERCRCVNYWQFVNHKCNLNDKAVSSETPVETSRKGNC